VVKKLFLRVVICLVTCSSLINQEFIKTASAASNHQKNVSIEIRYNSLGQSPKVITVSEETDLTLIVRSDEPLVLDLHGYDITAKVEQSSKAFMKLNTFATG